MEIFFYCYAGATATFSHFQNAEVGKTHSLESILAFRASLMSSFHWPLNCFNCTFSSFRVKACSPLWEEMPKSPETVEFACFLAVRALKRWRQPSGGVQKRQLVTVERHQLNRRSDAIRQHELVQPSTQIDRGGVGGRHRAGGLSDNKTIETIQATKTTLCRKRKRRTCP